MWLLVVVGCWLLVVGCGGCRCGLFQSVVDVLAWMCACLTVFVSLLLVVAVVAGFLARFTMILVILNFIWFIGDDGVMQ